MHDLIGEPNSEIQATQDAFVRYCLGSLADEDAQQFVERPSISLPFLSPYFHEVEDHPNPVKPKYYHEADFLLYPEFGSTTQGENFGELMMDVSSGKFKVLYPIKGSHYGAKGLPLSLLEKHGLLQISQVHTHPYNWLHSATDLTHLMDEVIHTGSQEDTPIHNSRPGASIVLTPDYQFLAFRPVKPRYSLKYNQDYLKSVIALANENINKRKEEVSRLARGTFGQFRDAQYFAMGILQKDRVPAQIDDYQRKMREIRREIDIIENRARLGNFQEAGIPIFYSQNYNDFRPLTSANMIDASSHSPKTS